MSIIQHYSSLITNEEIYQSIAEIRTFIELIVTNEFDTKTKDVLYLHMNLKLTKSSQQNVK
ncbi:MAG: hypothetical protein RR290_00040 [Clostridia bacterium]